jgi:GDP-L-fucose synthase
MKKTAKIYIAGHKGMVGSAIWRNLKNRGYNNLIGETHNNLDLCDQRSVANFFKSKKPEYVFMTAAKVGGIIANSTYKAQFIYENLMIQNNTIHQAHLHNVKKLVFMGSSCIYPKFSDQPIKESYLLNGILEKTNEPYAIAKIAGIKLCESYYMQYHSNFISVMPTNLYGSNDNYDLKSSHVLPALIRKFYLTKALEDNDWGKIQNNFFPSSVQTKNNKEITQNLLIKILKKNGIYKNEKGNVFIKLWGTGEGYREFLHVDDLADATVHIMNKINAINLYDELEETHINIGTGNDIKISNLANLIKSISKSDASILWDTSMPDGAPKKQLDVKLLENLKWKYKISLEEGINYVYNNYTNTIS